MNQKIAIFSFVALPPPSTKTNHPRWDLGKEFFASLYRKIKDQNPSISEDFTKTFLKWPRDGLETTWRQCWSALVSFGQLETSGRQNVLRKLLRIPYRRLKAGFSVCWWSCWSVLIVFVCLLLELWMKCTRCERLLPVKHFYLTCLLFFSSLENYFGFRTTNVKGKTDHSVSLRWNKRFWTFLKRRVFFWLCIRLIYELISPGWIKTRLYSVISSYGYFFYMPRFIYLCRTSFILVFSQRTVMLMHASEQTCAPLNF